MPIDTDEIRRFLSVHHPFDLLPGDVLAAVAAQVSKVGFDREAVIIEPGDAVAAFYVVRRGAIETRSPGGQLLARLGEGECFGIRGLLGGGRAVNRSQALEDTLLYELPKTVFERLRREQPAFAYFVAAFDGGRFRDSMDGAGTKSLDLLEKRVGDLISRAPVMVAADTEIRGAARRMRDEKVSCVMVGDERRLLGILTDRDLRNRVVAEELAGDAPVSAVMTPEPYRLQADDMAFDALLLMSRHNIHHLPVMRGDAVVGCLTSTTLIQSHSTSPLYIARNIHGCQSAAALREVVAGVPRLVGQMADMGATAHSIGHVVTTLTDAVTVRLLQLAEAELGPPPVPYAWMAAGSQAREEQTALSDQDNCVILHDSYDPAVHGAYFEKLSATVCAGLDTCGYVYCPGEMMAMTAKWRQPLRTWKEYFRRWIEEPDPKALMLSCVFFDLKPVHGDASLFEELQGLILEKTRKNRIFLAYMARNAMSHQPPIGFFRNLVLIHGGEHDHTLDLKHSGVVPIVDLARVYALASGLPHVNTRDRLLAACEAKGISRDGALDLADALEFVALTRLRHQARQIREGRKADNYLSPEELSGFERSHLKTAFSVVKTMQASMANAYQLGRF